MKTLLLTAFAALTLTTNSMAQVPPCTHYQGDYSVSLGSYPLNDQVIGTYDGNLLVIGTDAADSPPTGYIDGYALKVTPSGTVVWNKDITTSEFTFLYWGVELPDHGYLLAGTTLDRMNGFNDGFFIRLDPDGDEVWRRFWHPSGGMAEFIQGVLTDDGAILLNIRGAGIRIDLNGNVISESENFNGQEIERGADGSFVIERGIPVQMPVPPFESEGEGGDPFGDVGLINVDQDGAINWVNRIKANSVDRTGPLLALADGYLVAVNAHGGSAGFERLSPAIGDDDIWLVRLDVAGTILWDKALGSIQADQAAAVINDGAGGYTIMGSTNNGTPSDDVSEPGRGGSDLWVVNTDVSGNALWDKRWGGSDWESPLNIVTTAAGYLLIGNSNSSTSGDHRSVGYDRNYGLWLVRMEPGVSGHWYPDGDGDGFGQHGVAAIDDCDQPSGYVENDLDCDDAVPNPSNVYLGAICNDLDWSTAYATIVPGCACEALTIDPGLLRPVQVVIIPDYSPGDISWELREVISNSIVLAGGPYPNAIPGVPISTSILMPPVTDQRYQLSFFDAHADGIPGGGYTLNVDGKPVIISDGKYYQTSRTDTVADFFNVPLGNTKMKNNSCGRTDLIPNSVVQAKPNDAVSFRSFLNEANTGYEFWVFDPHGGYSQRVFQSNAFPGSAGGTMETRASRLRLSAFGNYPLPLGVQLNIRVRTVVQGLKEPFGPACTLTVIPESPCPITRLENRPNEPHLSCGMAFSLDGTDTLWAIPRNGVNLYEFKFNDVQSAYEHSVFSGTPSVVIGSWNEGPLLPWHIYDVRVRCSTNGGRSWCRWGKVCKITTEDDQQAPPAQGELRSIGAGGMQLYPNPVTNGLLHLVLPERSEEIGAMDISIMDMSGRVVLRRTVDMGTLDQGRLDLRVDLEPGAYGMLVSQGGMQLREQFIVQ